MKDNKNNQIAFPQPEPPPHPHDEGLSRDLTQSSQKNSDMPPSQQEVQQPQKKQEPQQEVIRELKPRKKFPKGIIVGGLVLISITLLLLVGLKFRGSNTNLCGKKGEVVWWGYQHDEGVYKPLIDEYRRQNPNLKITYIKQSRVDYRERLTNALAQCSGPDIFEIHQSWIPMFRTNLSVLPTSVMTEEEFSKSFYPIFLSSLKEDRGIVGLPLEYDALTLFINEDIFALAAKSPPQTWDDLRSLVDPKIEGSLTVNDEKEVILQSGVALGETVNVDHWPEIVVLMLYQNGVNPAEPIGEPAEAVIDFFTLFKTAKVWDSTLPPSTTAFARGKLAMYFAPTRRATDIIKANPDLRFRTSKLPQLPKNLPTDPDFSYASFWFNGVWGRSVNQEEAWKFLEFLATPQSLEKINASIKLSELVQRAYPRPEMNTILREDKILGSIIANALDAKVWYAADDTNDGLTGINSQIKTIFEEIIAEWNRGSKERLLERSSSDLRQILSQYGVR